MSRTHLLKCRSPRCLWEKRAGCRWLRTRSGRDLPLYEPGRAGETLLGELAVAGIELDAKIRAARESGCNEGAAAAGKWIQHQIAGA